MPLRVSVTKLLIRCSARLGEACEKKLSCSLLVWVLILQYHLPDSSIESSSLLGCQESLMIFHASIAGCRCPGGWKAHLWRCVGLFKSFFAGLCGWEQCSSHTRQWCRQSGCFPQYSSRIVWESLYTYQNSSVTWGRGDADGPSSPLIPHEQTRWGPWWCEHQGTWSWLTPLVSRQWWWGSAHCSVSWRPPLTPCSYWCSERDVVIIAPVCHSAHLFSIGWLFIVCDQAYHHCGICEFDRHCSWMWLQSYVCTWSTGENCGVPLLRLVGRRCCC